MDRSGREVVVTTEGGRWGEWLARREYAGGRHESTPATRGEWGMEENERKGTTARVRIHTHRAGDVEGRRAYTAHAAKRSEPAARRTDSGEASG